jgi:hypothetical protein
LPERPDAGELLDVARESLLALVADTEPRHHYMLRMVANAMAIARREIGASIVHDNADALWRSVEACDAQDAVAQKALHAELVAATRARLAVSNPKFLDAR